jgi:hypothetical protein
VKQKLFAVTAVVVMLAACFYLLPTLPSHAQQGGVATVVGGVTPSNQFAPSSGTGLAGVVTNPSSNFVVQVAGGPIYYGGNIQTIGQSQFTLPASSTNLIVWNGLREQLYSKQAVTGPGSSGTSVGIPTSLLYADPNQGELALATVVCNATACGNGGNGSITDNRALANFPAGTYLSGHVNQAAAGTTAALNFAGSCTLAANTCTMTFPVAFQAAPVCLATDQTTPQLVKAPPR